MQYAEPIQRCDFPNCGAACCIYGAWVDQSHADQILTNTALILPHMPDLHQQPELWFLGEPEEDEHTLSGTVVHTLVLPDPNHYGKTACVFLRADYKCALQVAAEAAGMHPWHFKPFYCILHPLMMDEDGRITVDQLEALIDEPASCLRPADRDIPLTETFAEELAYLINSSLGNSTE
jgi:hypothetical protein